MGSGTYNYALGKTVTADSYIMPYEPGRAVNGTLSGPTDRWMSAFSSFETEKLIYKVDLGAAYVISRYVIKSICVLPTGGSVSWPEGYGNMEVAVVYSTDDENWHDLGEDDKYESIESTIDREFSSVSARYFMLAFPMGIEANKNFVSIAQLEVYNTACQYLSALTPSAGTLSPSFSGTTQFSYTATVDASATSITLTPTAISPSATINVNSQTVSSGATSYPVQLSTDGNTAINVDVSDAGLSQRYTILVSKNSSSYLRSLTMNENDTNKSAVTLSPIFDGRYYFNYTANVGYDALNSGSDSTQVTVTPTAEVTSAMITVNNTPIASGTVSPNFALNIGSGNNIQVICVSGQNAPQTYTIAVTKASSPYLSGVANMPVNVQFKNTTLNYTGTTAASQIYVTPVSEDPAAHITVKSGSATQQVLSGNQVKLTFTSGQNTVTIGVSSATGSDSRTYTFTVNKT